MKPTEEKKQIVVVRVHVVYLVPIVGMSSTFLWKQMNWNNPRILVNDYIHAISAASKGLVQYQVASESTVNRPFPLTDGYEYRTEELLEVITRKKEVHTPSGMDYKPMLTLDIMRAIRLKQVDEVWVMGYPYAGMWESAMGGPDPFFVNGGPILGTESAGRRFVVMGFNYERGVGEMLESFDHRVERMLCRAFDADRYLEWFYKRENYGVVPKPAGNPWEQFLIDQGTVHREAGAPKQQDGQPADYYWHHGIEEHHRRWLGGLQADWWKRIVNVNDYF